MGVDFGITADSMESGLQHLNIAMARVAQGQGRYLGRTLQSMGISVKTANGQIKDMHTFLGDIADKMQGMSTMRQNLLVEQLGLSPEMVRMLRNGREEFERMYQTAAEGLPFTADDYKKAEEFEITFRRARASVTILTQQIALKLMPMFQRAMDKFLKWWRENGERVMNRVKWWVNQFAEWGQNVFGFIGRLTGKTGSLEAAMKALGVAVGVLVAMKIASWAMSAVQAFMALMTPMGLVALAIGAIIAIILLLIDDYEAWKKGEGSVIGTIMVWWDKMKNKTGSVVWFIIAALKRLKAMWELAKQAWKDALRDLQGQWGGLWPKLKQEMKDFAFLIGAAIFVVLALAIAAVYASAKIVDAIAKINAKTLKWDQDPSSFWKDFLSVAGDTGNNAFKAFEDKFKAGWQGFLKDPFYLVSLVGKFSEFGDALKEKWAGMMDIVKAMFLNTIASMIDEAIKLLPKWTQGVAKALGIDPGKLTAALRKQADTLTEEAKKAETPAAKAAAGVAEQPAAAAVGPPQTLSSLIPPTPLTNFARGVDNSQLNSNNITQKVDITVSSVDEAAAAKAQLDEQNRQQQRNQMPMLGYSPVH
jgi:hypothetical protein